MGDVSAEPRDPGWLGLGWVGSGVIGGAAVGVLAGVALGQLVSYTSDRTPDHEHDSHRADWQ